MNRSQTDAKAYWSQVFDEVRKTHDPNGQWLPYYPRLHPDGTTIDSEFIPTYDAFSNSQLKAVVICETEAGERTEDIAAWLRLFDPDGVGPFAKVHELNIQLVFSRNNAAVARSLLEQWIQERTDPDNMEKTIRVALST